MGWGPHRTFPITTLCTAAQLTFLLPRVSGMQVSPGGLQGIPSLEDFFLLQGDFDLMMPNHPSIEPAGPVLGETPESWACCSPHVFPRSFEPGSISHRAEAMGYSFQSYLYL